MFGLLPFHRRGHAGLCAPLVGLIAAIAVTLGLTSSTLGAVWTIEKDVDLYGSLDQHDTSPHGGMNCGPTAATNSLVYLQNRYPGIYGTNLVPDHEPDGDVDNADWVDVANTLVNYMDCTSTNGTFHDMFIWGKHEYMEDVAPGLTVYEAQDWWTWSQTRTGVARPDWVENVAPTWDFIYNELLDCEDVEILVSWHGGGGHYVTPTSLTWDDELNSGTIGYMDPWDGNWYSSGDIRLSSGFLEFDWGFNGDGWDGQITTAVSQSPIPEPASIVIWGLLCGLVWTSRRVRRARSRG